MSQAFEWLQEFWHYLKPAPTDPILWHCKPLVIVSDDNVVLARYEAVDVLFTPSGVRVPAGIAELANVEESQEPAQIDVDELSIFRGRAGVILTGRTDGHSVIWYTDSAAESVFEGQALDVLKGSFEPEQDVDRPQDPKSGSDPILPIN